MSHPKLCRLLLRRPWYDTEAYFAFVVGGLLLCFFLREKFGGTTFFGKGFLSLCSFLPLKITELFLDIIGGIRTHHRYHSGSQGVITRQMNSRFDVLEVLASQCPIAELTTPIISCVSKMCLSNETAFATEISSFGPKFARHCVPATSVKIYVSSTCFFSFMRAFVNDDKAASKQPTSSVLVQNQPPVWPLEKERIKIYS